MSVEQTPAQSSHLPGIRPPDPPVFDNNIASSWKLFKQKWNDYAVLSDLEKNSNQFQVALLRRSIGDDGLKIDNGFKFSEENARTV